MLAELSSLPGTKLNLFVMYRVPSKASSGGSPVETDGATGSKEWIEGNELRGGLLLLPIKLGMELEYSIVFGESAGGAVPMLQLAWLGVGSE